MDIVVSGVRPTGSLHLGNYFGATRNFVRLQDEADCFFFVADYHSLTTHPNAEDLHQKVRTILSEYLACGLDPEKCKIYVQSDLPEISELYLLFNMFAHKGELERSTTYKDKVAKQQANINAGLLTYPVLMAVDIIIHKAVRVPVGKDQEQHLEMARTFVNRFNHTYGVDYFPEPQGFSYSGELIKIPSLDGTGKMSASAENQKSVIYFSDEPSQIKKKIMSALTDSGPTEPNSEKPEYIQNLFDLMAVVSKEEVVQDFDEAYNNCSIRYGDMKKKLAEDVLEMMAPIQDRIKAIFG